MPPHYLRISLDDALFDQLRDTAHELRMPMSRLVVRVLEEALHDEHTPVLLEGIAHDEAQRRHQRAQRAADARWKGGAL